MKDGIILEIFEKKYYNYVATLEKENYKISIVILK